MSLYNLLIVSPCFYETSEPADLMVKSAKAHGLKTYLYGVGKSFIPHGADAQVFQLAAFLRSGKCADYVLMTDCRDVLFLADAAEIIGKFKTFNNDLVISTEQGCWPPDPEVEKFFHGKSKHGYDFVNGGQYIGTWDYALHCLTHLLATYRGKTDLDNSQGWWMQAGMRGELDYSLDSNCEIFQSMSGGVDGHIVIRGKRAVNTATGSQPCSVHFNGNPGVKQPHLPMYWRLIV
jgi:hypothetical protein